MNPEEILNKVKDLAKDLPKYQFCSFNATYMLNHVNQITANCIVNVRYNELWVSGKGESIEMAIKDLEHNITMLDQSNETSIELS